MRTRLRGAPTIRPAAGAAERKRFAIAGTALDYRIRFYFPPAPVESLVAAHGAAIITHRGFQWWGGPYTAEFPPERLAAYGKRPRRRPSMQLVDLFFEAVAALPAELQAVGRRLDPSEEERLVRHCYALALFERVFRHGIDPENPLFSLRARSTVDDLLACAPAMWVDDICRLSGLFEERCRHLFEGPMMPNPEFDGSLDVGGADADFIVRDCLLELKARTCPLIGLEPILYQLLGYALLDYSDRYKIRNIGVYFARQGVLISEPLEGLLATTSREQHRSIDELRAGLRLLIDRLDPAADQRRARQVEKLDWYQRRAGSGLDAPSLTPRTGTI